MGFYELKRTPRKILWLQLTVSETEASGEALQSLNQSDELEWGQFFPS